MKKLFLLFLLCVPALGIAQLPQGIKYQVVVRDMNAIPLANKAVSLRISMLQDSITGASAYTEVHNSTSNAFGLITLSIGSGTPVYMEFKDIQWNWHEYFAKVEVDTTAGTNYTLLGISQLMSVPYAFHSKTSSHVLVVNAVERDALQNLSPGLQVFNTDDNCLNIYTGSQWTNLCAWRCEELLLDTRDAQAYPTVRIGNQCWMAKNLNIGTMIHGGLSPSDNGIIEKYCSNNKYDSCQIYGGLYNWNELMGYVTTPGAQGICPLGWHIPTEIEWTELRAYLGGSTVAGGLLKETGTNRWKNTNIGATNSSGFTALPSGLRSSGGSFLFVNRIGNFISSNSLGTASFVQLVNDKRNMIIFKQNSTVGASVRCLKDE